MTPADAALIEFWALAALMVVHMLAQTLCLLLFVVPALVMSWIFIRSGGVAGFAFVAMLWWLAFRAAHGT